MPRPVTAAAPLSNIKAVLAAPLAAAGTITLTYPALTPNIAASAQVMNKGHFFGVGGHKLVTADSVYSYPNDFELTFNAPGAGITLTWRNAGALPAGKNIIVQLNRLDNILRAYGGIGATQLSPGQNNASGIGGGLSGPDSYILNLGAPLALSATAVCAAQAAVGGANALATVNGGQAAGGVAYMDTARNVTIVSSNAGDTTQTVTVRGTDLYGQAMTETIAANGTTTVQGLKAFFTVTSVRYSANLAGNLSVGMGDKIGLPVALYGAGYVLKEISNGAAATAGTFATAAALTPTATTADTRGTYLPNSANNGTNALQLVTWMQNPGDIGQAHFSG